VFSGVTKGEEAQGLKEPGVFFRRKLNLMGFWGFYLELGFCWVVWFFLREWQLLNVKPIRPTKKFIG